MELARLIALVPSPSSEALWSRVVKVPEKSSTLLNTIEDINTSPKETEVTDNKANIVNDEDKPMYNTKSVEKIVIFYSDKTFVSYNPSDL